MSHVFISYSHDDIEYRDRLIDTLQEANFGDEDIWYDEHIEAGDYWRDEIREAIDDAFAIIVIVTEGSMKSHYCTHEWSYAMGIGLPILPIRFEDHQFDIPDPLLAMQYKNCTDDIPITLIERLQNLVRLPKDIEFVKKLIFEVVNPAYEKMRFVHVLRQGLGIDWDACLQGMFLSALKETEIMNKKLLEFMVDKSYALTKRQRQRCRELLQMNNVFALSWRIYTSRDEFLHDDLDSLLNIFQLRWIPLYKKFDFSENVFTLVEGFDSVDMFAAAIHTCFTKTDFEQLRMMLAQFDLDDLKNSMCE